MHSLIRHPHVQRSTIGVTEHSDGLDPCAQADRSEARPQQSGSYALSNECLAQAQVLNAPSLLAVVMMRQAISPRFATSSLSTAIFPKRGRAIVAWIKDLTTSMWF